MSDGANRDELSVVKRALLEIRRLKSRVSALEAERSEPIAIVGLSVRAPGDVTDAASFARLLWTATDAITPVPASRWAIESWYAEAQDAAGKMYTRHGGFLDDVDLFDAELFGIAPVEAASMDPQQRLVLELAWQALEDAGHAPSSLAGTRAGVYLGISNSDYGRALFAHPALIDPYFSPGNAFSVAAGRVSYVLGLLGPAISIDTACSSSLVALHLACQAIRRGECDLALAGGVNLVLTPELNISFSRAGMMSRDGRCRTFDADAAGYVRGEGGGMLVLRRLRDALADGDRILALVRGSAVNQDGRSNGLTAPNGPSQEAVIRAALDDAGIAPSLVGYVETHGTGTPIGDPIEVNALSAVLGHGRDASAPLWIGSVKTNIGHLEAAAGVAGVIKTILALERREIPPHLHFHTPNPFIDWNAAPLRVPVAVTPWRPIDGRLVAGVSSFGFSGTNAHVVLEAAPEPAHHESDPGPAPPMHVLALSARRAQALGTLVLEYRNLLRAMDPSDVRALGDVCFTANAGRTHHSHRASVSGASAAELADGLSAWLADVPHPRVIAGEADAEAPRVAFLFPGQGPQYAGMGRQLYDAVPAYRQAFDACADLLDPMLPHPIRRIVLGTDDDDALVDQTAFAQPAMFAVEYALASLWKSWGIAPSAVMGHSFGEYAAACVAGVMSLSDAALMVVTRGRLVAELPGGGRMTVVEASYDELQEAIRAQGGVVTIAAINGPANCVVSGEGRDVTAIAERFAAMGRRVKPLRVSHAFHSPLMEPVLDELERRIAAVRFAAPAVTLVSTMTGEAAALPTIGNARYWRDQLRLPVRFAQSIGVLAAQRITHFVELSPHPVLLGMAAECVADGVWLPSLREHEGALSELLLTLQRLYADGASVDWAAVTGAGVHRRVALPTYPFQRQRHWISAVGAPPAAASAAPDAWKVVVPALAAQAVRGPLDLEVASYPAKWDCLSRLTSAHLQHTLHELGAFRRAAETHTLDTLLAVTGILPVHRHLVSRWLVQLVRRGVLQQQGDMFTVCEHEHVREREREGGRRASLVGLWAEAEERFRDNRELLAYVRNCTSRLAAIVTGRESPLESLFPGGSFDLATSLYEQSATMRYINALAAAGVEAVALGMPAGRMLRVLEIGAGTGGTTSSLLRVLPADRTDYLFTDVSELFLDHARRRFAEFPQVRFGRFDLDQDSAAQGHAAGQFDVVVSANCVHAAPDLRTALARLRALLAPGGVLMLVESTVHHDVFDMTTGLIEGWQAFSDDLRSDHPLLTPESWTAALRDAGFVEAGAWPERGSLAEVLGQHLIAACAPGEGRVATAAATAPESGTVGAHAPLIARRPSPNGPASVSPIAGDLRARLSQALPVEWITIMSDAVRREVMRILRLAPDSPPSRHERLMDLGMDSLMAVQLRNALASLLGLHGALPATLIFDHPTIEAIARFLLEQSGFRRPQSGAAPAPDLAPASAPGTEEAGVIDASRIASMSDDEIAAVLLAREGRA